mmetsp:Transcript_147/g.462  ORF Transcript_147/g.462 Transcript_147/m.462 type:complete len:154 (+) Transcript_147:1222-1683(+)
MPSRRTFLKRPLPYRYELVAFVRLCMARTALLQRKVSSNSHWSLLVKFFVGGTAIGHFWHFSQPFDHYSRASSHNLEGRFRGAIAKPHRQLGNAMIVTLEHVIIDAKEPKAVVWRSWQGLELKGFLACKASGAFHWTSLLAYGAKGIAALVVV